MAAEHTQRIGRRIKEQRKKAGLTQRELAEAIPGKADGTQISKWERGRNRPSDDTLEHIAKALGCDVAALHVDDPLGETPDLMGVLRAGEATQLDRIEAMLRMLVSRLPASEEALEQELREAVRQARERASEIAARDRTPRRKGKAR